MQVNIRLTQFEIESILATVKKFDKTAITYLFGSRTNTLAKGGDIDLLIISELLNSHHKLDLLIELKLKIGEQKIDLLIKNQKQFNDDPFCQSLTIQELKSFT
ncbi:MAG: nucleotidyltransferase domain-containing protein [Halobacteriovoraceae bacterium]|jgi:uncharacterized protein|nr:nucleotidyltransferase domain-containing protein [Halobacteriovoraceae bacterium]